MIPPITQASPPVNALANQAPKGAQVRPERSAPTLCDQLIGSYVPGGCNPATAAQVQRECFSGYDPNAYQNQAKFNAAQLSCPPAGLGNPIPTPDMNPVEVTKGKIDLGNKPKMPGKMDGGMVPAGPPSPAIPTSPQKLSSPPATTTRRTDTSVKPTKQPSTDTPVKQKPTTSQEAAAVSTPSTKAKPTPEAVKQPPKSPSLGTKVGDAAAVSVVSKLAGKTAEEIMRQLLPREFANNHPILAAAAKGISSAAAQAGVAVKMTGTPIMGLLAADAITAATHYLGEKYELSQTQQFVTNNSVSGLVSALVFAGASAAVATEAAAIAVVAFSVTAGTGFAFDLFATTVKNMYSERTKESSVRFLTLAEASV